MAGQVSTCTGLPQVEKRPGLGVPISVQMSVLWANAAGSMVPSCRS